MNISVVIVQFNHSADTIRCLESIKKINYSDFSIVVVDNHSETEHLNNVKYFIENQNKSESGMDYKFFALDNNLGYAGGNNVGIKYAIDNGADFVLILNPDTTVEPDLLSKLSETDADMVGCGIDEGIRIINAGIINWLKPELAHTKISGGELKDDYYVPGACVLIKKNVFQRIGLFDDKYFLYFEDADFCQRTQLAGFKIKTTDDVLLKHQVSSSTGNLGSPLLLRYHYRNALLFNYKFAPLKYRILLPFWSFFIILKQLVKLILRPDKREFAKAILAGVLDFHLDKFGIIKL